MTKPKLREDIRRDFLRPGIITVIETKDGERYSGIPIKDFDTLMDLYDSLPHPGLQNINWQFVIDINWRIYTEECISNSNSVCRNFDAKAFKDFVTNEIHFELVRKGCLWNEKDKKFENLSDEQYQQTRQRIFGGLVLKAIELFSGWDGKTHPVIRTRKNSENRTEYFYDDKRNLRGSLVDYVSKYDLLKTTD
jgi:hypothetical protein